MFLGEILQFGDLKSALEYGGYLIQRVVKNYDRGFLGVGACELQIRGYAVDELVLVGFCEGGEDGTRFLIILFDICDQC